ncbi:MAG: transposase [Saprospiraceae bacterium]|nr:transposase [Saprospiraceae bacterium]
MQFEPNVIYHIYNQGNNRQRIFFKEENYLFFLKKMREFLLPYGDLLCYCLMPNHFHWLMYVRESGVGVTPSHDDTRPLRSLNDSIGILLRSYTRAINKQEDRTGALFREKTKAKDGWDDPYLSPAHPDYGKMWKEWDVYGSTCFNYIHNNPVKAGLANHADDWPYSSSLDFSGKRNGTLCNQALACALLGLP